MRSARGIFSDIREILATRVATTTILMIHILGTAMVVPYESISGISDCLLHLHYPVIIQVTKH